MMPFDHNLTNRFLLDDNLSTIKVYELFRKRWFQNEVSKQDQDCFHCYLQTLLISTFLMKSSISKTNIAVRY
jgi:hypothetical protein